MGFLEVPLSNNLKDIYRALYQKLTADLVVLDPWSRCSWTMRPWIVPVSSKAIDSLSIIPIPAHRGL